MKNKFLIIFLVIYFTIILTGCIKKNDEVILKTNGGVPYVWKYSISNKNIVKFKCKKVEVKDKNVAGGVVVEYYIFSGLKEGSTKIKFEYKNIIDNKIEKVKLYKAIVDKNLDVKIVEKKY